jgi:hypothetical protein
MKLVEVLVALALTALVISGVVMLVLHTTRLVQAHPDRLELHQRARVALDLITRDLRSAGAGVDRGPATGVLTSTIPSVWPRRIGRNSDGPTTSRNTAITILAVPDTLAQTLSATAVAPATTSVDVEPAAHCTAARPACGFGVGTTVGIFDPSGGLGLWNTQSVASRTLVVRSLAAPSVSLDAGAVVTELRVRGYLHDEAAGQLRYFDGDATHQVVIDGVTALTFRFFDAFGEMPIATLADGPWRGSGDTLFDVDLLRVRRVRVELALAEGRETYQTAVDVALRNAIGAEGGL